MTFGPYIEHRRTNRQTGSKQVWSQVDRVPESCVAAYGIHQNDEVHACYGTLFGSEIITEN